MLFRNSQLRNGVVIDKNIISWSYNTGWLKKSKVFSKPWHNSHVFYFQNLICFWLSTPRLRFWHIDISFLFTIGRDTKSWIRDSDLNIFKKGRRAGYQFQAKSQRYVNKKSLPFWVLSCLCTLTKTDPWKCFFSRVWGFLRGESQQKTHW